MQRHHKRTPYSSNSFPIEPYRWDCDDVKLHLYGQPSGGPGAAEVYRQVQTSGLNPFLAHGWIGTCRFPQITAEGLQDSWQHGADLYSVYRNLLGLLPITSEDGTAHRAKVSYRVTNNMITSQVGGMVISGMWNTTHSFPLLVEVRRITHLKFFFNVLANSYDVLARRRRQPRTSIRLCFG